MFLNIKDSLSWHWFTIVMSRYQEYFQWRIQDFPDGRCQHWVGGGGNLILGIFFSAHPINWPVTFYRGKNKNVPDNRDMLQSVTIVNKDSMKFN